MRHLSRRFTRRRKPLSPAEEEMLERSERLIARANIYTSGVGKLLSADYCSMIETEVAADVLAKATQLQKDAGRITDEAEALIRPPAKKSLKARLRNKRAQVKGGKGAKAA